MADRRVHLMYGLAGSGKSTLARELSAGGRAVRFTLDEWMTRVHPDVDFESREYGDKADHMREVIWSVAEQVLAADVDVVLDWNFWSVERRRWAIDRAAVVHAPVTLHRLSTPIEVASERALARAQYGEPFAHHVTRGGNEHLATLLQEPSTSEGLDICEH